MQDRLQADASIAPQKLVENNRSPPHPAPPPSPNSSFRKPATSYLAQKLLEQGVLCLSRGAGEQRGFLFEHERRGLRGDVVVLQVQVVVPIPQQRQAASLRAAAAADSISILHPLPRQTASNRCRAELLHEHDLQGWLNVV
jgi:hypothetical protein